MSNESVEVQSLRHHVMSSQPRSHQEMDVPPLFEDSKQVASPASPQPLPNLLFQRREKSDGDNVKKYPLYRHQVSGHFPILWNSAGTICKPVNSRELHFYSHLKEKFPMLLPFVPKFFGVMDFVAPDAAQEESSQPQSQSDSNNNHDNNGNGSHSKASGNGSTTTSGSPNSKYQTITATSFIQSSPPIMSSINSAKGHIKIEAESLGPPMLSASASSSPAPEPVEEHIETETEHSSVKRKKSTVYNEWGSVCHEKKREVLSSGNVRYLVLEDLTRAYEKPCILDLKIGTQQHSDDDPPAKKQSKIAKCAKTTSASLGLRFSGSQVFDVSKGEYIFQDKYFGRSLDAPGLYAGLHDFFYNGVHFRRDVVRVLLRRLTDFRDVMKQERVFLFRSSSLLFVYEGVKSEPVDVEALFPQNSAAAAPAPTVVLPTSPSSPLSSTSTSKDKPPSPALTKTRHNSLTQSPFPGFADVRFIDFAHIDDANGALDDGVLCGLNNLISALAHFLEVDNDEVAHVSPDDIGAVFTRSTSVSSSAPSTSTVLPHQQ